MLKQITNNTTLIIGIVVCLCLVSMGSKLKIGEQAKTQLNLCDLKGQEAGSVKATVIKVEQVGMQYVSTISNGCQGTVTGGRKELGPLYNIGAKVKFVAQVSGGTLVSPTRVVTDELAPDPIGHVSEGQMIEVLMTEHPDFWGDNPHGVLKLTDERNHLLKLGIDRDMAGSIHYGVANKIYYANKQVIAIIPDP